MGSLLGHVVPGTFFTLFGIWWGFSIALKYYKIKTSRQKLVYKSTTTFSCICCKTYQNLPMESYFKLFCSIFGMLGEFVTGFKHVYDENLKRDTLIFGANNTQHITMFLAFALASLFEIFVHYKYPFPDGIEFLANIFAYGIQAFLFHFHLHGRNDIDIHVHTLLVYAILFCMFATMWEYARPNQILATYARIAGTFLQGVWFLAVGLILYFPSKDPYWIWSPNHGNILILTVIFIWIALCVCIFLFIQSKIVWSILDRRHTDDHHRYNEQTHTNDDDESDSQI